MNQYKVSSPKELSPIDTVVTVSEDGYVRLMYCEVQNINLIHLISGLDEDMPVDLFTGAVVTVITGYTEWVTPTSPAITIGWDWQMDGIHDRIQLRRISEPRCNVMLQDSAYADLGVTKTLALLEIYVDSLEWQQVAQAYVANCAQ